MNFKNVLCSLCLEILLVAIIIKDQSIIIVGGSCHILRPGFNRFNGHILVENGVIRLSFIVLLKKLGRNLKYLNEYHMSFII